MIKRKEVVFSLSYYNKDAIIKRKKCFFSYSYYDHNTLIKRGKSFFHFATMFRNEERKIFLFIYSLGSLRHDEERKFLFHLSITITTLWWREKKVFFSFSYYDHYAMIKTGKSFFYLASLFTNEERKMFFFI